MGHDIHGGETHQHEEREQTEHQTAVACVPSKEQDDGADTYMTAGECSRRTLARLVSALYHLIEYAIGIARTGKSFAVQVEVVANVGKNAHRYLFHAHGRIVILRTRYGQGHEHHIIDKEGGDKHERRPFELGVTAKEVKQRYGQYHGEVRGVAHVHQFAKPSGRHGIAKHQRRLKTKHRLLGLRKHMVEVGQHAVKLVGVGIPPRKQIKLCHNAR